LRSVVKITATAPDCRRRLEGTGFVYAPQRVMTNAHVVAGSRGSLEVSVPAGRLRYQATVVLYDPHRDVAVLAVPGLRAAALEFNRAAVRGAAAVIPGYPPHASDPVATAAQIRTRHIAYGPDIYQSPSMVRREIFTIRAGVQSGVSGAPLLATDGTVYGVVFATALDHDQTAYALTAQEISSDAQAGRTTSRMISAQGCAG
jgi:S1-C subfamily serine protease